MLIADVPLVHGPNQQAALVTLAVLTGAIMLVLGLLKLVTLVRFVPNAVLTGFVNAVAVNIVLAQLADFTGFRSEAGNRLLRAADTLINVMSFDWPAFAVGAASIGLILLLERTVVGPLRLYGSLFFASAPVFEAQLPVAGPASTGSAVVLRLRGKEDLGSTFIEAVSQYVASLNAVGSHLILAGVSERVLGQLTQTGAIDILGEQNVFPAEPSVGAAVTAALGRARELVDAGREDG